METKIGALQAVMDRSGGLWIPGVRTLVVADLHLEKGSSLAARGHFAPPYDTAATLVALNEVVRRLEPARVICLGDSFHDMGAPERISESDRILLDAAMAHRRWTWVGGNHDPRISLPFDGETASEVEIADVVFRHEPSSGSGHEVCGHLHPAARLRMKGQTLRRKCFLASGNRLVLPAMGTLSGGLNVLDKAFALLLAPGACVHMLAGERPYRIEVSRLSRD